MKIFHKANVLMDIVCRQNNNVLFVGWSDFAAYLLAKLIKVNINITIKLRPRLLGNVPVYCRLGKADIGPLDDLLFKQYYLFHGLKAPAVILDLGANVGYPSAHFAALYPDAKIYAVEPDQGNFEMAKKNTQHWGDRIIVERAAIWSKRGYVSLSGSQETAFMVKDYAANNALIHAEARGPCAAITVDDLLEKYKITHVDYVKMDIETAEYEVLLNSPCRWLEKVSALMVEYHSGRYDELVQRLEQRGFRCRKDGKHWSALIAVRPDAI